MSFSLKPYHNSVLVSETDEQKVVSHSTYNYVFNKRDGTFLRWGLTTNDDPTMAPAFEILDWELSTVCSFGCSFCSPSGTMVMTNVGEKLIEDIKVGDIIIGSDLENCRDNEVVETYSRHYLGELIIIELENNRVLKLTPEHRVYTTNRGWIEARYLSCDDDIILHGE